MQYIPESTDLLEYKHRGFAIVHETKTAVCTIAELIEEVMQATREPPLDIPSGNVVSTMRNTLSHMQHRHLHTGQSQVDQFHLPAVVL